METQVVRGFLDLLPESCAVMRNGKEESVPATQLVVGDVILIKNGNRVPADARILVGPPWMHLHRIQASTSLKLETSSITGEAEPVDYQSNAVAEVVCCEMRERIQNVTVFESRNIAFNGSMCVDGHAVALVVRTGIHTVSSFSPGQRTKH